MDILGDQLVLWKKHEALKVSLYELLVNFGHGDFRLPENLHNCAARFFVARADIWKHLHVLLKAFFLLSDYVELTEQCKMAWVDSNDMVM